MLEVLKPAPPASRCGPRCLASCRRWQRRWPSSSNRLVGRWDAGGLRSGDSGPLRAASLLPSQPRQTTYSGLMTTTSITAKATPSSHHADDDLRWNCPGRCQQRRRRHGQAGDCRRGGGRGRGPGAARITGSTRTINHRCPSMYSAASFCIGGTSAAAGPPTPARKLPQMPADRAVKRHPQTHHRQRCAAAGDHSQRARKGAQARRRRKNMPFFT